MITCHHSSFEIFLGDKNTNIYIYHFLDWWFILFFKKVEANNQIKFKVD